MFPLNDEAIRALDGKFSGPIKLLEPAASLLSGAFKKLGIMSLDLGGLAKFYNFTQHFLDRQGKIYVEVVAEEPWQALRYWWGRRTTGSQLNSYPVPLIMVHVPCS